jgi:probable O-glycosylation ligase (exosortase A-associated)
MDSGALGAAGRLPLARGGGVTVLRTVFIFAVLIVGWGYAVQGPLYAACLYLWIAYFRPESWAWSDLFTSLNLSYFAGAFLVLRTVFSDVRIRIDLRSALMLAFLLLSLVSTYFGVNSAYSFAYWWDFAKVIIVAVLLTNIIQTSADLRLILIVICISLGFEAGKQGWAQLILNPGARNDNSVPFLGDNNLVAVGMAMLLPVVGALAATATGWQKRAFQFLSVGVLYRGLSTYSRGGFLSMGAVGVLWFWRSPHKLRTLAAVALAAMLILPVLPQQFWDRMGTITASAEERDESQAGRLHFWQVAVAMANDRPFLGVGHSGYPRAYNAYDWSQGQFLTNRAVHSAWFGVLAEAGYPGLLLFIAIVFLSWRTCRRVRAAAGRGEVSSALGRYAVAFEASLVAFMIGGSFVSFQYCEMLWHFFALTTALERVAVAEAAAHRAALEQQRLEQNSTPPARQPEDAEPDFAWA